MYYDYSHQADTLSSSYDDKAIRTSTTQRTTPAKKPGHIQIVSPNNPQKSKKNRKPVFIYSLGPREGNTRIIGTESVSTYVSVQLQAMLFNENYSGSTSSALVRHPKVSPNDGSVGTSNQGTRGDCYFLAEINSIRNTRAGQKILDKNIHKNNDGSVTVTLPGAVRIRQEYAAKGLKCEVTGTYVITAEAIAKAQKLAGKSYSQNDMDTISLEIAMENYRAEMVRTNKLNGNSVKPGSFTAESAVGHLNSMDYLNGGRGYDAGFILTGKKSDVYFNDKKRQNVKRYSDGQYGYITRQQMLAQSTFISKSKAAGISEISHLGKEERDLYKMLDKYEGHESEYALTCSVRVKQKGQDGVTPQDGSHAISIVKITDDTVYVANPWHPNKIEPIPRKEFVKMAYGMYAMPVNNTQSSSPSGNVSGNLLNSLLGKLSSNHTGIHHPGKIKPNKLKFLMSNINSNSERHSKVDMNTFVQMLNNASIQELDNSEKTRMNNLLRNLSSEDTNDDTSVSDFEYFLNKFAKEE